MSEGPTRVLLIRHAVNDWIGSGKLPGWTPGVHLNDHGRLQAQALAGRLANAPIKGIYSSPLERTQETAQAVADQLGLPIHTLPELGEAGCGEWTGQLIEELAKTDLWRQVQFYPSGFRFPGGEAMVEMQSRMVSAVDRLRSQHPGELIALFSHSDPIRVTIAFYSGMPLDLFQRIVVNPASITEFGFSAHGPQLVRVNDCAHLPPDPEPEPKPQAAGEVETSEAR